MGKSAKLFKSFVTGVKVFKSPSKEQHAKDSRDHVKKRNKDRCFGSLGKSSSRNHGAMSAAAASPEAIEIKCVQVESEKLKEALPGPVAESFGADPVAVSKVPATREGVICGSGFTQPDSKEQVIIPDHGEELAAVKIQAAFRCYLAQRAFQALRALVRLQALARGRLVRRRAAASLRCVHALIRVQALARGRRVRNSELGQLLQKHLQQTKHSRKKSSDGWVGSTGTTQQSHGKGHVNKHDVATKRQRALVYTYSEQLNRRTKKDSPSPGNDGKINKSHWAWEWLELWTATTLKGSSIAVNPVEGCTPVVKNLEKAKAGIKGIKHSEISRKERRKLGEHAESTLSISQRGPISEEHEAASVLANKEEEFKAFPDSEKLRTATLSEQKPVSTPLPPAPNPPPLPMKAGIALDIREFSQPDMQSSDVKMVSDVPTLSQCATEAIQPFSPSSDSCLSGTNAINNLSGANTLWSPNDCVTSCPEAASYISPSSTIVGAANGHTVIPSNGLFQMRSDSPSKDCRESSLVSSLSSPEESCITSELPSMDPSSEVTMSSPAVACGSMNNELSMDGLLSRTPESLEVDQVRRTDVYNTYNVAHEENGDKVLVLTDNIDDTLEPDMIQVDAPNDESTHQGDNSSGTNGKCDAMMVSNGASLTEVSGKSQIGGVGLKHEQTECISPSVPSYMATTMSSKAKIRSHTSPKQKADLTKQKLESPKPKSDSPKTKGDSPSQKPNSVTKRRYSLSALDGKVSMATQNQQPASHIRTNSRGNFSSMKDLSVDNFTLPNGDSRRHGKQQ